MPKAQTPPALNSSHSPSACGPTGSPTSPTPVRNPPVGLPTPNSASRSPPRSTCSPRIPGRATRLPGTVLGSLQRERQTDHHPEHESEPDRPRAVHARARGPGLSRPHLHSPRIDGRGSTTAVPLTSTRRRCAGHAEPTIRVAAARRDDLRSPRDLAVCRTSSALLATAGCGGCLPG